MQLKFQSVINLFCVAKLRKVRLVSSAAFSVESLPMDAQRGTELLLKFARDMSKSGRVLFAVAGSTALVRQKSTSGKINSCVLRLISVVRGSERSRATSFSNCTISSATAPSTMAIHTARAKLRAFAAATLCRPCADVVRRNSFSVDSCRSASDSAAAISRTRCERRRRTSSFIGARASLLVAVFSFN